MSMSVRVMSVVWQDAKEYREGPLLVLLALADWANDDGWCWPSVPAIAAKARLTERQVYNVLSGLQRDGVIVRQGGGGRGKQTRYQVVVANLGQSRNPEMVSGFTEAKKPEQDEAGFRVSEAENPEIERENPEIGDTKTLKLATSQYIEPSLEPSGKNNTPQPPSQASGASGAEIDDVGDEEIADAVICANGVAGKRRQKRSREVLLSVIAQERAADHGLRGEELQLMLIQAWEEYRAKASELRWTYGSPDKFYATALWRKPEAWPWRESERRERPMRSEAMVGMYRGPS